MTVNKTFFVPDASVILKWFLEESEEIDLALGLKNDFVNKKIELAIPEYTLAEIFNILGRERKPEESLSNFSYILSLKIERYPMTIELVSVAIEIMNKFSHISFYDAGYHALAVQYGGIFITADKKYYQKTKRRGHIMLLKDYGKKR